MTKAQGARPPRLTSVKRNGWIGGRRVLASRLTTWHVVDASVEMFRQFVFRRIHGS